MYSKKFLFFMSRYGFFAILIFILLLTNIFIINNYSSLQQRIKELEIIKQERLMDLEETVLEQFYKQTGLLLEAWQIKAELITEEIDAGTTATSNRINLTDNRIQQINTIYAGLLAEMERRTLDSLFSEVMIIDKEQEAAALFREGRFIQASEIYLIVSEANPDNFEARFFHLYSLFLSNRMNRSNYPRIVEGLEALERHGFHRREIREILEFIESEERWMNMEMSQ